ncbi:MAG: sigma-E processing peptidase SpoIIGA [Clostridium sp.]|uniref:sigma-E processing peptidase SpoIIGA n=1 Tax=Clostridium sp. TaxID=1506 RepID=UPI003F374AB8
MKLYLDVLVIENFIVNLFIIIITFRVLKYEYSFKKALCISFLGGLYSLCMVLESLSFLKAIYIQIIVAFLMIYIPSAKREGRRLIKSFVSFMAISFLLSGLLFKFIISTQKYTLIDGVIIKDFNVKYLILGVCIVYIGLDRVTTLIRERNIVSNFIYEMKIEINNKEISIRGFLDSGNELREPVTNLPCILIEKNKLQDISVNRNEMYKIPYKAIGYSGGLYGFKVKKIKILKDGDLWREIEGIVCPCDDKLSKDDEFNGLISRGVI